jgi:signal transduction histidine kinase
VVLSAVAYLFPAGGPSGKKIVVVLGMTAACVLGNHLYKSELEQTESAGWRKLVPGLELAAYGAFTFLSGGLSSPYLWYYIGCIFIISIWCPRRNVPRFAMLWIGICVLLNRIWEGPVKEARYLEWNICLGIVIVLGAFCVLLGCNERLARQRKELVVLNRKLEEERSRAEQALLELTEWYDTFNLFARNDEKNRIANEIHDTVIQKLFGIACSLRILELEVGNETEETLRDQMRSIKRSAELTMTELREAIYGMQFEGEDNEGLLDKLRQYLDETRRLSGTIVTLENDNTMELISASQKIAIYRVICESVNNAVRHGQARKVQVGIHGEGRYISVEIRDDGTGFQETENHVLCGNGIRNMRRLADALRGELTIATGKYEGSAVRFQIPR